MRPARFFQSQPKSPCQHPLHPFSRSNKLGCIVDWTRTNFNNQNQNRSKSPSDSIFDFSNDDSFLSSRAANNDSSLCLVNGKPPPKALSGGSSNSTSSLNAAMRKSKPKRARQRRNALAAIVTTIITTPMPTTWCTESHWNPLSTSNLNGTCSTTSLSPPSVLVLMFWCVLILKKNFNSYFFFC